MRHLAPARLDDLLQIGVAVTELGRATLTLEQQAWRGDVLVAEGTVRVACADATNLQPRRLPEHLLQRLRTAVSAADTVAPAPPACNNPLLGGSPNP